MYTNLYHESINYKIFVYRIAFVEFKTEAEAAAAIETYNESELDGRKLSVSVAGAKGAAKDQEQRG